MTGLSGRTAIPSIGESVDHTLRRCAPGTVRGRWDAPPDLEQGWTDKITAADQANAPQLLTAAFDGSGPFVWKDPRVSLLLPFWKPLLEPPLAAVLIWRDPMAVAESLQRRDNIDPVGLALWERYNRAALDGLVGVDTYVIQYEDLLKDPEGSLESMAGWLDSLPGSLVGPRLRRPGKLPQPFMPGQARHSMGTSSFSKKNR